MKEIIYVSLFFFIFIFFEISFSQELWIPTTLNNAPLARSGHTAKWTGSKMIVWGGYRSGSCINSGGIYDPVMNTWTETSLINAPSVRERSTSVWTGIKMIIWGGRDDPYEGLNTGGIYDPGENTWTATSTIGAPSARYGHTAVWTGSKMIIWGGHEGGYPGQYINTGGVYDPVNDEWTPTSINNAPHARAYHTAIWTGNRMIVWGGTYGPSLNTGGVYNPVTDSWTITTTVNAPFERNSQTAIWTSNEMIIWGGTHGTGIQFNTGGRYNPVSDSWILTTTVGAPSARSGHTALWTGSKMVVWGGFPYLNDGGIYDPISDSWSPISIVNAPSSRSSHTAVWADNRMIIWGGYCQCPDPIYLNTGGIYTNPVLTGIEYQNEQPKKSILSQNYPNPFNPNTKIKFQIPKLSGAKLVVYDVLGKEIQTLVNEELEPGTYEVDFDGGNLPSGVYYYTLSAGDFLETKKMVLIK